MKWRLIIDRGRDPYWNMALDEALLVMRENNRIPNTIRLYYFSPSSITIGYFQEASEVVNLDYVVKNNILFTRRITGGGAVFHDENGEVTYSVTALLEDFPSDIIERYRVICNGLIYAINSFGLKAIFKPVNDILVNGKKISGSAQT
ncbi:MAG: lipoate--protein ligase, partial [Desulfurococcales archaeon ex4484_58]